MGMRALKEQWPRLIHNVLDSALDRCCADLNSMFRARGIYQNPDIRLIKATYSDMQEWHNRQRQANAAGTFNWHACLDLTQNHPLAQICDAMVAVKYGDRLTGFSYYRFHPNIDNMHIMQVERLTGDNPLKGNFTYIYLNGAVSLAHALDVDTIKITAPFYWGASSEQKIRGLGFQNDERGDLVSRVPLWAKGYSYTRYSHASIGAVMAPDTPHSPEIS